MSTAQKRWLAAGLALLCLAGAALGAGPARRWYRQKRRLPDENGLYQVGQHWFRAPRPLDTASVDLFAQKVRQLQQEQLNPQNRVFCAVIPDKSEFAAGQGWPALQIAPILQQLEGQLGAAQLVDLTGTLALGDYYKADGHWRQEALQPVLDALGGAMGFAVDLAAFQQNRSPGFVGAYTPNIPKGRAPSEELIYLTGPTTQAATVELFGAEGPAALYDLPRLATAAPYDVYLGGATPLATITSPAAATDRQLVIFRDSFASSLAPLLCGQYRTITLVDLRYMASGLLPQYLEFTDQDVLFLYSAAVVNRSAMLR